MNENSKVKALFFAQYLGQNVLHGKVLKNANLIADKFGFLDFANPEYYLLLRTVDQLTDEEYKQVAIMAYRADQHHTVEIGKQIAEWIFIDDFRFFNPALLGAVIDYLRSIGILLPFTYLNENGKPQTLQPDEILQRGWAKIK